MGRAVVWYVVGVLLFHINSGAFAQKARTYCNIGADPVNAERIPEPEDKIIKITNGKEVVYKSGSGRNVKCWLRAGTPIVIGKSGLWVLNCGNPIVSPKGWMPKGKEIYARKPKMTARPEFKIPNKIEIGVNIRHSGEISVLHKGEVLIRQVKQGNIAKPRTNAEIKKKCRFLGMPCRAAKIFFPIAIGATGVAVYFATKNSGAGRNITINIPPAYNVGGPAPFPSN